MAAIHRIIAVGGTIICLLPFIPRLSRGTARAVPPLTGFLLTVLVTLPLSAAITGALSAPHDRYQARIMWLPPFMAAIATVRPRLR
jgi:hypothetical protein